MNIAVVDAYSTLNSSTSLTPINFYTNNIPETSQTLSSLPLGRIVELNSSYTVYASDNPVALVQDIQVDVWVKDLTAVEQYYYTLDSVLRADGWGNQYSSQETDPDLQGAMRIIKRYSRTLQIEQVAE